MEALTAREREVLLLTARHLRVREIAAVLAISHHTVRKHRANLCAKLELHGKAQLAAYLLRHAAGNGATRFHPRWKTPDAA